MNIQLVITQQNTIKYPAVLRRLVFTSGGHGLKIDTIKIHVEVNNGIKVSIITRFVDTSYDHIDKSTAIVKPQLAFNK